MIFDAKFLELWRNIKISFTIIRPLDKKGSICHFSKWQTHPFIFKGTICVIRQQSLSYRPLLGAVLTQWSITQIFDFRGFGWKRLAYLCLFFLKICPRPFGYEMVYLPLCKMADTPFHIQRSLCFQTSF